MDININKRCKNIIKFYIFHVLVLSFLRSSVSEFQYFHHPPVVSVRKISTLLLTAQGGGEDGVNMF